MAINLTDDTLSLCQDDFLALKLETPQCRVKTNTKQNVLLRFMCILFAIYLFMTRKPRQLKTVFVQCFEYQNNIFTIIITSIVNAAVYNHMMMEMQQLVINSDVQDFCQMTRIHEVQCVLSIQKGFLSFYALVPSHFKEKELIPSCPSDATSKRIIHH